MTETKNASVYVLPKDFRDVRTKFELIDAGKYDVSVDEIKQADDRIDVQYVILDEGRFLGRRLFQTYVMTTQPGMRLFKELLEAIDVEPEGQELALSQCTCRVLRVRVKHNEHDEKTYANVVEHITQSSQLTRE
ncbi:hypothetical protein JYT90_00535 [bacterium AH-315-P07]|nr:hypothetical protein [bacterium AH-315-P07]